MMKIAKKITGMKVEKKTICFLLLLYSSVQCYILAILLHFMPIRMKQVWHHLTKDNPSDIIRESELETTKKGQKVEASMSSSDNNINSKTVLTFDIP